MKTYAVLGRFEDTVAADAVHAANPPAHSIVDGDVGDLSNQDLARIYNAIPGIKTVNRFADRATAVKRVMEVLNAPPSTASPDDPAGQPSPPLSAETTPTPEKETTDVKTKKGRKAKSPAAAKTKRVGAPRLNGAAMTIELTAAGKKDGIRFNAESPRSKVFAAIKKADGASFDSLVKKFDGMTRGQVLGCVQKLKAKGYVKVVSS
jgi:hypothetical protein